MIRQDVKVFGPAEVVEVGYQDEFKGQLFPYSAKGDDYVGIWLQVISA
jgi:hypothetical protein